MKHALPLRFIATVGAAALALAAAPLAAAAAATPNGGADPYVPSGTNPMVPYGTDDYLVCPVCSRGLQISHAQLRYIRSMSGATASLRAGRLTQDRYMAQVERFWRQLGVNPAGQQLLTPASPGAAAPAQPAAPPRPAAAAQPAVPPPPVAAAGETSWIAHLQKLAQLHDQGVLSDADYEAAKRRVLEQK